jgi:hypothetical protein
MTSLAAIARAMGGEVRGHRACFPTPGHSEHDRGSTAELVDNAPDGVLVKSYNGGDPIAIKDRLRAAGVLPQRGTGDSWRCMGTYEFRDEGGALLYRTERLEHSSKPKRYVVRLPDGSTKMGATRRVLYRLPELLAADPADTVFLTEGERKADKLASWGLAATAFAFGAKSWRKDYARHLAGRHVVILPDNDDEGRSMAETARRDIKAAGGKVTILALPGLPAKGDIMDWSGDRSALLDLVAAAGAEPGRASLRQGATIDGAELLDDVLAFYRRFVAFPSPHSAVACALWAAHAHAMDCWDSTPRLAFLSPEPGSGKSRALEIAELLVPRPVQAVNVSPAYLFRKVADPDGRPTILHDEIDTVFGPKVRRDVEETRGLLNAGHRRGAMTGRCKMVGKAVETEEIEAYCAVALAGLGDLPDTVASRAVIVRMRRRAPGERVEPYRRRNHQPGGAHLCKRLGQWANVNASVLASARPDMPSGVEDRAADVWEPLLAIADTAGGDWPKLARDAAEALVCEARETPATLGVRLLADIRAAFGDAEQLASAELLDALNRLEEAPWGDLRGKPLDSRRLARMLRPYNVSPETIRTATGTPKGYKRQALWDAWQRYLPATPSERKTGATSATSEWAASLGNQRHGNAAVADVADVADVGAKGASACARCAGVGCKWCEAAE